MLAAFCLLLLPGPAFALSEWGVEVSGRTRFCAGGACGSTNIENFTAGGPLADFASVEMTADARDANPGIDFAAQAELIDGNDLPILRARAISDSNQRYDTSTAARATQAYRYTGDTPREIVLELGLSGTTTGNGLISGFVSIFDAEGFTYGSFGGAADRLANSSFRREIGRDEPPAPLVFTAQPGDEFYIDAALFASADTRFDAALLDLGLPDSAGLDTLVAFREWAPELPVVVMTGTDDELLDQAAVQSGANGYVVKNELSTSALVRELRHGIARCRTLAELRRAEHRAQQLATHDPLTGLANRRLLSETLNHAIHSAGRSDTLVAVLALDLDRFKSINDVFGHSVGDEILRVVAGRIAAKVRSSDCVARVGGDEFVVVLTNLHRVADAALVAEKLISAVSHPVELDSHEYRTSTSIGISTCPGDASDAETLLASADAAMYHSKRREPGAYCYFSPEITDSVRDRLVLESQLRGALDRNELFLEFQPLLDLRENRWIGFEALVRWRTAEGGLVSPGTFIPIAEELGLIDAIGTWVLREAYAALADWRRVLELDLAIFVNVSAKQLRRPELFREIEQLLIETGLPARALTLEVTESTLVDGSSTLDAVLSQIRELGIGLGIDDFGTGYSCLAEIKRFPVTEIKVDRLFVRDLPGSVVDSRIVETVVSLANALGCRTVAEGIEEPEQLEAVRSLGCGVGQGYLLARPMPKEAGLGLFEKKEDDAVPGEYES